jgi:hypothetical protein
VKNFYQDNEDIQLSFKHLNWQRIVSLHERDFKDSERYAYAPENTDDAVDNYQRVLNVLGEIAAEYIAPRSEEVDLSGASLEEGTVSYAKGTSDSLKILAK